MIHTTLEGFSNTQHRTKNINGRLAASELGEKKRFFEFLSLLSLSLECIIECRGSRDKMKAEEPQAREGLLSILSFTPVSKKERSKPINQE